MEQSLFTGVCTALVTPFLEGKVNYPLLQRLLARQVEAGIPAVVMAGTTGEAPTLSDCEKLEMVRRAKQFVGNDCLILAGTGSNCTEHAVALSKAAQEVGADGLLVVSPYYNKATEEGLIAHYSAIAGGVQIPVVLYNVPSRTGVDMSVEVYRCLSQLPNIAGVKEANPDIGKAAKIRALCPENFALWSGSDDRIAPMMALGGAGVVSVVSNLLPVETLALTEAALAGDFDTAADLQLRLLPLIDLLFREVNPIPVKAAMKMMGYDCGPCRLPLTPISHENAVNLKKELSKW